MARLTRLSLPGLPHLVLQRGHNAQPVFRDADDRIFFRQVLREVARANGVAIHAYALREQEVALLITPVDAAATGKMMQALGRRYGHAFNRRHGHTGSLWEGRFRATVLEAELHLLSAMRWLESSGDSSLEHHTGKVVDPLITEHPHFWSLGNTPFEREMAYRQWLGQPAPASEAEQLKSAVLQGWPLGSPEFMQRVARLTDRRLEPLPRGRPVKSLPNKADPI
jgi:putative transposase